MTDQPDHKPKPQQDNDIQPWRTLESTVLIKDKFKHVEVQRCLLPDGQLFQKYYIDRYPDWVNVVALTPTDDFLFVKQYRHAFGRTTIETAAGTLDPGETDPLPAAQRELREETGFVPGALMKLGCLAPNPALQNNRVHIYLATDCVAKGEPHLDSHEDIEVVLVPKSRIWDEIARGTFEHALALVALYMALDHLQWRPTSRISEPD